MTDSDLPDIGRYRVLRRIGVGGMAQVFLAENDGPGGFKRQVVIKKVHPRLIGDDIYVQLFLREARVASRLRHANVVSVLELGEHEGEYFIVMEYLDGLSLRSMGQRSWLHDESLPTEVVLTSIADAALGLHHAHTLADENGRPAKLVHRDISPDNLMLCRDGVTKVLDFGLAKGAGETADNLTSSTEVRGKVSYMAPEQLEGAPLDRRCDIFALGASLYWLLTAKSPFKGATDALTIHNVLAVDPPLPSTHNPMVSREIDGMVARMLAKNRADRPADALEVYETLVALAGGVTTSRLAHLAGHLLGLSPREGSLKFVATPGFLPCTPGANAPTQRLLAADAAALRGWGASASSMAELSTGLNEQIHELPTALDQVAASTAPNLSIPSTQEVRSPGEDETGVTQPSREPTMTVTTGVEVLRSPSSVAAVAGIGLVAGVLGAALLIAFLSPAGRAPIDLPDPPADVEAAVADVPASALVVATTTPAAKLPVAAPVAQAAGDEIEEIEEIDTPAEEAPVEATPPPRRKASLVVRLKGPSSIRWKHRGRTIARGTARASLPGAVTRIDAVDSKTGGVSSVEIVRGVARYADVGTGKAFFLADPWAKVTLGARALGTTPFAAVSLPVGKYTAVFERGGQEKVEHFAVKKGRTTRVTARMR